MEIPDEAMHPGGGREELRRTHPVKRYIQFLFIHFVGLVRAGVPAHKIVGTVEDLESNGPGRIGLQVVVDDRAVRWISSGRFFRWERRIRAPIPTNADGGLRPEE